MTSDSEAASQVSPSVSVIVPFHNREATVVDAIQSVLDQDYPDFEVVAVDDGSTDGSRAALEALTDSRLRVIRKPASGGAAAARNTGAAASRSKWIAFQDSDDLWLPGKLHRQIRQFSEPDVVAAYCGMVVKQNADPEAPVLDRVPNPALRHLHGDVLHGLLCESFVSTQTLIVRRDIFEKVGRFDEMLPALEDWDLMLRVAQLGLVAFLDDTLVVQRFSSNSITHSMDRRLAAQEAILEKYAALLALYPDALARHHERLSGGFRRKGAYAKSAYHATRAARLAPSLRSVVRATVLQGRALLP